MVTTGVTRLSAMTFTLSVETPYVVFSGSSSADKLLGPESAQATGRKKKGYSWKSLYAFYKKNGGKEYPSIRIDGLGGDDIISLRNTSELAASTVLLRGGSGNDTLIVPRRDNDTDDIVFLGGDEIDKVYLFPDWKYASLDAYRSGFLRFGNGTTGLSIALDVELVARYIGTQEISLSTEKILSACRQTITPEDPYGFVELSSIAGSEQSSEEATIVYKKDVAGQLTRQEIDILTGLVSGLDDKSITISDIARSPEEQAQRMLDGYFYLKLRNPKQTVNGGLAALERLYGTGSGRRVVDLWTEMLQEIAPKRSKNETEKRYQRKFFAAAASERHDLITEGGKKIAEITNANPYSFSHVTRKSATIRAVDISPSSVSETSKQGFLSGLNILEETGIIRRSLTNLKSENAYHIEFYA